MDYLVDSNILLRIANMNDSQRELTDQAIDKLTDKGEKLYIVPQCCYEFWAVSTRPSTARSGLGLSPMEADFELEKLLSTFTLLRDQPILFDVWRELVDKYGVSGVNAHDARLVAAMKVQGLSHLLTFNTVDFARYSKS